MREKTPSVNDPHIVHCRGEGRSPNEVYGKKPPKKMKKKSFGTPLLAKAALFLLIIALLGGARFGVSTFLSKQDADTTSSNSDTEIAGNANSNVITTAKNTIVVKGNEIYFDNQKVDSVTALKDLIYADYKEGETYVIKDDKAIKDTYDSVKNLFLEISIPYIEE